MDAVTLALLAVMLLAGGDGPSTPNVVVPPSSGGGGGSKAGRIELLATMGELGVPADWQAFAIVHAMGESGLKRLIGRGTKDGAPPDVHINVSAGEASAAAQAYDKNAAKFAGSPWLRERYVFGSGGWFGQLPAYALAAFDGSWLMPDADPWWVFEARASVLMWLAMCDRLQQHDAYQRDPTFLRLRGGFRNLATMKSDAKLEARRPVYTKAANRAGIDPALLDETPSPLGTRDWAALLEGGTL